MRLIEATTIEPDLSLVSADRHPLDEAKRDEMAKRLTEARKTHGREGAYKHSGLPRLVLNQHREVVNGRTRQEAAKIADVPVEVGVFQFDDHIEEQKQVILENLARTHLTPEQEAADTAALVKLLTLEEELRDNSATELPNSEGASKRGRKSTAEGRAMERAADALGITRQGVQARVKRDQEAREPVSEPLVAKAPKPVPVEKLILEFADKLEGLAKEGAELLPKALAEPGQATGATWRGSLRGSMGALAKEVEHLRQAADDIKRARVALANNDFKAGEAGRIARAKAEFARRELLARENDPNHVPGSTTPGGDIEGRIAKGGGLKVPKREKKVQIVVEKDGKDVPYEEALAVADAAGVGGGPPEEREPGSDDDEELVF